MSFTVEDIRQATETLERRNVPTIDGEHYVLPIHPIVMETWTLQDLLEGESYRRGSLAWALFDFEIRRHKLGRRPDLPKAGEILLHLNRMGM